MCLAHGQRWGHVQVLSSLERDRTTFFAASLEVSGQDRCTKHRLIEQAGEKEREGEKGEG